MFGGMDMIVSCLDLSLACAEVAFCLRFYLLFFDDIVKQLQSVNMGCYVFYVCTSIILYADDILLLAPSISGLQKLLSLCDEELHFLDMQINDKMSVCIRFGIAGMMFVVHQQLPTVEEHYAQLAHVLQIPGQSILSLLGP